MNCERAGTLLHGYFDGELDAAGAAAFERHLERCSECVAALESLDSLRSSITLAQLYEKAPPSLHRKVRGDIRSATPAVNRPWLWLAIAAAVLVCALAGWQLSYVHQAGSAESLLAAEVVDAHLRSLQPGHLTDVVSSDQHTVKPWFAGKLDFSPPVHDFSEQGFPLRGGRLEIIRGHAAAALVYGRRKHLVNVFIWPIRDQGAETRPGSHQGYQWIEWRDGGMEFCAVSDASFDDLNQLRKLFSE